MQADETVIRSRQEQETSSNVCILAFQLSLNISSEAFTFRLKFFHSRPFSFIFGSSQSFFFCLLREANSF